MKLISMTDFVLQEGNPSNTDSQFADKIMAYANFLKQPLELWMFVPCGLVGNEWAVLEYVKNPYEEFCDKENVCRVISKKEIQYQQAKDRCLFEGFEVVKIKDYYLVSLYESPIWLSWNMSKTIEDLVKYNLELTKTAIK